MNDPLVTSLCRAHDSELRSVARAQHVSELGASGVCQGYVNAQIHSAWRGSQGTAIHLTQFSARLSAGASDVERWTAAFAEQEWPERVDT
jgi:hypothetical protein